MMILRDPQISLLTPPLPPSTVGVGCCCTMSHLQRSSSEGPPSHASNPFGASKYNPTTQHTSLRSSLKSTPQYANHSNTNSPNRKGAATSAPSGSSSAHPQSTTDALSLPIPVSSAKEFQQPLLEDRRGRADSDARIEFCHPHLLACINCQGTWTPTTRSNRQQGPVLLELKRLQAVPGQPHLAATTVCLSRSNPSLGTSLLSTCLSVAPAAAWSSRSSSLSGGLASVPPPIVTGLTTGALCLHSFTPDAATDDRGGDRGSSPRTTAFRASPSMEFFQTPTRQHRPATAVAWRPSASSPASHVAIGLQASSASSASASSAASGASGGGGLGGGGASSTGGVGGHLGGGVASTLPGGSGRRGPGGLGGGGGLGASGASSGGGRGGSSADRDYCCFVWDIEHQAARRTTKSTPVFKLSHQIGVASLGWLLDGSTLAVGGQSRLLQLYDVRGSQQAPVSVYANHQASVHLAVDPTCQWQLATFAKAAANETVKIWDCRRMDAAVSEIKIGAGGIGGGGGDTLSAVSAVQWSRVQSGRLIVSVGNVVHEYDTSTNTSRPVPVQAIYARDSILDFCLYPSASSSSSPENFPLDAPDEDPPPLRDYFSKRLMAVYADRTVTDVARHTFAPVGLSRRDGRLAQAIGSTLCIGSPGDGPAAMEGTTHPPESARYGLDVSAVMMRRARCKQVVRYSMDPTANVNVLAEQDDGLEGDGGARSALIKLWSWIERVEELCNATEDLGEYSSSYHWPAKGLVEAGVWNLIASDRGPDEEGFADSLCCRTYDSPGRRAALGSCGWAGKFSLVNVIMECEDLGEFERSAALSVWHGDIGAAVDALERGATFVRGQSSIERSWRKRDAFAPPQYAELLELVALCVAGYRAGEEGSASSTVWRRSCSNLLQRVHLSHSAHAVTRTSYVRVLLRFLMSLGSSADYEEVLGDWSLSLGDRVAFACRFLPRDELKRFLTSCIETCQKSGNCEGLVVTGIEKEGVKILQAYVDLYADVQTAALVTSRVIFPTDWTVERAVCLEWLDSYRSLLNSWQMWQSRAMFDVDRADLLRKVKARQGSMAGVAAVAAAPLSKGPTPVGGFQPRARSGILGRSKVAGARLPDPDVQASVPAQVDARCNYCNAPLALRSQDTHSSQFLSKLKPVLSCCPQCRKPLPRCAICLLSLGTLNPYMELLGKDLHRGQSLSGGVGGGAGSASAHPSAGGGGDLSTLASMPFAEWFTWCVRCKHGGHAHHWIGWFAKHEVCPVAGCDCRCQFDAVQQLQRPTLLAPQPTRPSNPPIGTRDAVGTGTTEATAQQ